MQTLFAEIKNFIFKNLMTFVVLAVSAFLLVLILLWVTLLTLWSSAGVDVLQQIALVSGIVVASVAVVVAVMVFANKARLDRARAASLEAEVARNLVVVNEYRQAVLDYEKASNGKK